MSTMINLAPEDKRLLAQLESMPNGMDIARRIVRERAKADPYFFIEKILGYPLQDFHKAWFEHQRKYRRTILLAPRGHGKSTVCNVAYALWKIIRDPNVRILIASKTARQAILFLAEIRKHLVHNWRLRYAFGDLVGREEEWKDIQIRVRRTRIMKEPTITTIGIGGSLPSWHFDVIILDDPHDLTNSRTPGQRENVWRWFEETLLPTLEPEGELHLIGTRWDPDDLFGRLISRVPDQYMLYVSRAIEEDGKVLWPEKFSMETLEQLKKEMGPALFALQYQCDATMSVAEGPIFRASDFVIISNEEAERETKQALLVAQAWDLAVGEKDFVGGGRSTSGTESTTGLRGDYTACVTVALTKNLEFVVLDWWRGRPGLVGQKRAIQEQADRWNPHVIGIESVAYQAVLSKHLMATTTLPIKPLRPDRDKVRRAWAIQSYVEEGRVKLAHRALGLRDLLAAFPYGEEDDSVDAFVYAMGLAAKRERWEFIQRHAEEKPPAVRWGI